MKIVIPMAGASSRFFAAGFKVPKYQLLAKGRSLFDWALLSFESFFPHAEFLFVAKEGTDEWIQESCQALGIVRRRVHTLSGPTQGQAETVALALEGMSTGAEEDEGIVIFNIDTHLAAGTFTMRDVPAQADGLLQLFSAEGSQWSFARLDDRGRVVEVAEKKRISQYCSTGLYYFKSSSLFMKTYVEGRDRVIEEYGEAFVAPLYQRLVDQGRDIRTQIVDRQQVIPLGTPDEVRSFDSNFGEQVKNSGGKKRYATFLSI